jgi:hypothetical protein
MIRYSIAAGIALGLAVAAHVSRVPPANRPAPTGRVDPFGLYVRGPNGEIFVRVRWGSLPGYPPSGGYCVDQ